MHCPTLYFLCVGALKFRIVCQWFIPAALLQAPQDRSASPPPISLPQRRHRRESTADISDAAVNRTRGRHLTSVQRTDEIMRQQRREADKRRERRQRDRDRQQRRGTNRSARDKTADTLANFRAAARSLASARGGANGSPEEGRVLDQFLATDLDDADLERRCVISTSVLSTIGIAFVFLQQPLLSRLAHFNW